MILDSQPSFAQSAVLGSAAVLVWSVWRVVYNLYFHPLAHVPGPRWAAATQLWLAYKELWEGTSLSDIRYQLHAQYGDVIRLTPREIHFANPEAFHDIYNAKNKWDKDDHLYRAFDMDLSSLCMPYHQAKQRKEILNPIFSRSAIVKLQDVIQARVDVLCDALKFQHTEGKFSDMTLGFKCFAMDVITSFCYGCPIEATSAPDFHADLVFGVEEVLPIVTLAKQSRFFVWCIRNTPRWLIHATGSSPMMALLCLQDTLRKQIDDIVRNPSELDNAPHQIIYHALLNPEANKGRSIPSKLSLFHEAQVLLNAGSDTVGITLIVTVYNIINSPGIQQRLHAELRAAWPNLEEPPRYEALEKLPYLTAVLKEGLRSFPGGVAFPRVVPPEGAIIAGMSVPGGAVVSQASTFVQHSDTVFERAKEFLPDRWLGDDATSLERSLIIFSKGPRSCLGINLAYCELYLALAHVFRRYELTLDPKRSPDFTFKEHFVPYFPGEHLHVSCKPVDS
ncbi:putative P450 monooxygenase [Auriscalpium vulgare]|uniref:P450 monooxygenase n=1 Tax=Auriscalpium vulgare TaxID=40419 RepID=A0ACB8RV69_9AGAM|nr:putative P450 monooxygenase [Auriscalpium vulgare]